MQNSDILQHHQPRQPWGHNYFTVLLQFALMFYKDEEEHGKMKVLTLAGKQLR